MRTTIAVLMMVMVASCGKAKDKDKDEGKGGATPTPAPSVQPNSGGTAATPSKPAEPAQPPAEKANPAAEQCQRILAKSWQAVQPTMQMVGADPAAVEKYYTSDQNYVERCAKLTDDQRACMEKSDNPIMGMHECKVNEGKEMNERVWSPTIRPSTRAPELPAGEGDKLLASVVGTWVSDWKSYGQKTTWVIGKDGKLEQTTVRNGETKKDDYSISFERVGQISVRTTPTSTQQYNFYRADPRTFYSSNNLSYGIYPIEKEDHFVIEDSGGWLVVDAGKCTAVSERGDTADATCKWDKYEGKRAFLVEYQVPGMTRPDGQPMVDKDTYVKVGDALLDYRLVDIGKFTKK